MGSAASTETSQGCRFFLVRHGEVAADWQGRIYGAHDVPLSERGRGEAEEAARRLGEVELDSVFSSGLQRAEFGAAQLRRSRGLERVDVRDLRELERGDWVGRRPAELTGEDGLLWRRWLSDPASTAAPGGESLTDLAERVMLAMGEIARNSSGRTVAVVAHGWVLRVIVCRTLGVALNTAPRFAVPTGCGATVDWPVGGASRPVLASWGMDAPPPLGSGWFRGPRGR